MGSAAVSPKRLFQVLCIAFKRLAQFLGFRRPIYRAPPIQDIHQPARNDLERVSLREGARDEPNRASRS
jgi:hypothetical protein